MASQNLKNKTAVVTGVHIMIVCPGFVRTNLQSRALDGNGCITTHPQSTVGK